MAVRPLKLLLQPGRLGAGQTEPFRQLAIILGRPLLRGRMLTLYRDPHFTFRFAAMAISLGLLAVAVRTIPVGTG